MERDPKFVQLYNRIMTENKTELESLRKRSKVKIIGLIIICIIFTIFIFALVAKIPIFVVLFFAILAAVISVSENINTEKKRYAEIFKTKFVLPLVQAVFPSAEYAPKKRLGIHLYNGGRANVYNDTFVNCHSEDTVITCDENHLVFSEVKLEDEVQTKDGKQGVNVIVFWGLAGSFVSPVYFNLPIKILRNRVYYGDIKMDSEEFEANFNVYAEDKIETLSILTADVMTKLVKIKKRFGDNLEIVFFADKVYFRIDYSNLFEAKLNSEALSIESIEKYYNLLCNIKDMSEYIMEVLKNANI